MVENPSNNPLAYLGVRAPTPPNLLRQKRAPLPTDTGFDIGTIWLDEPTGTNYALVGVAGGIAEWDPYAGSSGGVDKLTGNSGTAIPSGGNIDIVGTGIINVAGAGDTLTISHTSGAGFPITPYVVGLVGEAEFQTIQAGLDAATAAGGGIVYVQPGTYTENLTLFGDTGIVGTPGNSAASTVGNTVVITGTHTPPTTGSFTFKNVELISATDILSSAAAGSAPIIIANSFVAITDGYIFNMVNWTGTLVLFNVGDASTDNGVVTNSGGAACFFVTATIGNGSGKTMNTSGLVTFQELDVRCPWNAMTGTILECFYASFLSTVTLSNDTTGTFDLCRFRSGALTPLTMSSSADVELLNSVIDTSSNPAIAGAGAGTLKIVDVSFGDNAEIAGTLTLDSGEVRGAGQITRFLVGAAPDAGYRTIQAALDAANAAGGGIVYVQPDTYVENLTLFDGTQVIGTSAQGIDAGTGRVTIQGSHTPPTSGNFAFRSLNLTSGADILFSTAAGSTNIVIDDCFIGLTDGFTFDLTNWTGRLTMFNCVEGGGDNGIVNNSGGSICLFRDCLIGAGTQHRMITSSIATFIDCSIFCDWEAASGTRIIAENCVFDREIDITGANVVGTFKFCTFSSDGSTPVLIMGSSSPVSILDCIVDTSFTPAISGAGAGVLTLGNITFLDNKEVAVALTLAEAASRLGATEVHGDLTLSEAATQLKVQGGGVNDFIGTATLTAGTVVVANSNIASTDKILITRTGVNASTTLGFLDTSIVNAVAFTIRSLELATPGMVETGDVSTVDYFIVRQL